MSYDIDRLNFLRKEVEPYLMLNLMWPGDNDLLRDNNVIEYEGIKNNVTLDLCNQIQSEAGIILNNINVRDFNLDEISKDLEMLGHTIWSKRNEEEILRDKLLEIDYYFYVYQYKNIEKFKELETANIDRLKAREEIKIILKELFKTGFQNDFKEKKLSKLNINDNHWRFFENEGNKIFEQRDAATSDRDTYAYINAEDYKRASRDGFQEAKHEAQSDIRSDVSGKIEDYLNQKIATQKPPGYYYDLDNELYDFVTVFFENRNAETVLKENDLLITTDTYREWSRSVLIEIKNEYLTDEEDEDDNFDIDEEQYDFDNSNFRYDRY